MGRRLVLISVLATMVLGVALSYAASREDARIIESWTALL